VQWLWDPNQRNVDNINNVRRETSRHFRGKKMNMRKLKLTNLNVTVRSITSDMYMDISAFRKVTSQELIYVGKDEMMIWLDTHNAFEFEMVI
jgi:hypothetical protein